VTRRFVVSGRVQGVGFRWFVLRHAQRDGLTGFTRNLPDGSVEVLAAGDVVALERLAAALRVGPPHARVDEVVVTEALSMPTASRFEIR
jgi:acylphosphatase